MLTATPRLLPFTALTIAITALLIGIACSNQPIAPNADVPESSPGLQHTTEPTNPGNQPQPAIASSIDDTDNTMRQDSTTQPVPSHKDATNGIAAPRSVRAIRLDDENYVIVTWEPIPAASTYQIKVADRVITNSGTHSKKIHTDQLPTDPTFKIRSTGLWEGNLHISLWSEPATTEKFASHQNP